MKPLYVKALAIPAVFEIRSKTVSLFGLTISYSNKVDVYFYIKIPKYMRHYIKSLDEFIVGDVLYTIISYNLIKVSCTYTIGYGAAFVEMKRLRKEIQTYFQLFK